MQTESIEENVSDIKVRFPVELSRGQSNNHHVVPIGILIVLCTIYLMIAGLQSNYTNYLKPGVAAVGLTKRNLGVHDKQDKKDLGAQPQPLCRKIEVFTKEVFTIKEANESKSTNNQLIKRRKQLKSGNGNKHNGRASKSAEANRKRDSSKKSNTAEPIIYLFALVFIYLLLKAASDINQHYKTHNKGDKRLRRCSLQSYAQKEQRHHQDRRASKDVILQSRHHIFTEARSLSLDRYRHPAMRLEGNANASKELLKSCSIHKQTSVGDYPRMHHPAMDNRLAGDVHSESRSCRSRRRLSVPISINYQTVHVTAFVTPEAARRGSVADTSISGLPLTSPSALPMIQTPDTKRRVRMINRH